MKKAKMLLNRVGGSDVIATSTLDHKDYRHFHVDTANYSGQNNKEAGYWFVYDRTKELWVCEDSSSTAYVEISNAKDHCWYYKDDNGNWVECEENHATVY